MRLNPPVITIRIKLEHLKEFLKYCNQCSHLGFVSINDYVRLEPTREALLKWHLYDITEQVMDKLYKHHGQARNKLVNIKFTHAARLAFSIFFKRVPASEALRPIETEIINQLILEK